jgi:tRNA dimethylallyltransferase
MQIDPAILQKCWFLAGPTACGKTAVSLVAGDMLARQGVTQGIEIVALDSMSLYREMDIGTAKATAEERQSVPHHLVDVIDPHEEYSLAQYVEAAEVSCKGILNRDRTPLFVGGTGLYLRGTLRGVFDGPPADWEYRQHLQNEANAQGVGHLHECLREIDPKSAATLHPNDGRRIIRALEVYHVTGRPISEQQQQKPLSKDTRPRNVFWLEPPRDWLYDRINRRVDTMIDSGLIDEVRRLLQADLPMSRTARQALGYKEVIDHLEQGIPISDTIDQVKTRTRQFAKRQHTWFRNLEECHSIEVCAGDSPERIAEAMIARSTAFRD